MLFQLSHTPPPRVCAAWVAAAFLTGFGVLPARAVAEDGFSVMTWNLEWFFDESQRENYSELAREKAAPGRAAWDWRRDAVAASIAEAKPTIVALQEVESRRVLWYLSRALEGNHNLQYQELAIEGTDHFTEQDVGLLYRSPADVLRITRFSRMERQQRLEKYNHVSKHLMAVFEVPVGDGFEQVIVMNVHLRARAKAEPIRRGQARLVHHWISDAVAGGEHVIVLGDINTEQDGASIQPGSDMAALAGLDTEDPQDDLVDLHARLSPENRRTHLLPGRQFDRILVSPSLIEDDPSRADLALASVDVRRELAVRGDLDQPSEHWDHYWEMPAEQRDLSDHLPIIATFEVR